MLRSSMNLGELADYVARQIATTFPDGHVMDQVLWQTSVNTALARYEKCCAGVTLGYFTDGTNTLFDHLNSDQFAMFLYLLCNTLHMSGDDATATRIYYLNKVLHGIDVYFAVQLPEKFMFSHPVGTVLGRATYGNYFAVAQNCTVGNSNGHYPVIGEGVSMYMGSMIAGASRVGDNVHVAANTVVRDQDVPADSIAIGQSPNLSFKRPNHAVKDMFFYYTPVKRSADAI